MGARSRVIWAKGASFCAWSGNPMPESVRDRPSCAYEEILLLAKSDRYRYDRAAAEAPETVDLVALVQRVCDDMADAGLAVAFGGTGRLAYACRPTALRRALANLIENAAKYGERARVTLLPANDHVVVRIDDDGPGVPEDRREEVFKPFVRLEGSRSRETGGTGLGLTVARSVARAHGGDIALQDHPGGRPARGGEAAAVTIVEASGGGSPPALTRSSATPSKWRA